jgi:hypothetical protein
MGNGQWAIGNGQWAGNSLRGGLPNQKLLNTENAESTEPIKHHLPSIVREALPEPHAEAWG